MNVHHTMFNCRASQTKLAEMLKKCDEDGGFCLRTVMQLIGSKKTTEMVLHFLTVPRVVQRPRAQGEGEEEQRRHRDYV